MESLEDERIISLKIENATLKENIEVLMQEGYETRKSLATSQIMKSELESEVEELHKSLKQYEEDKVQIQNQNSEATNRLKSKIQSLEFMLQEKEESSMSEIKNLQAQLAELESKNVLLPVRSVDDHIYSEYLSKAQDQANNLSEEINHYKCVTESLKTEEKKLRIENCELTARLDEVTNLLHAKNEEHRSCLQTLENVKEEKILLNSELAILKAPAADVQKRGNSLFAEVEDNRQIIQIKLNALKTKYERLKKTFALKNVELSKLKTENLRLTSELKIDKNETFWNGQIVAYKERIRDLQKTVNHYMERPESPQIVTIDATNLNNLQWVSIVVESARQEVRELKQQMAEKSFQHCFDAENHSQTQRENRLLKCQIQENKLIISDLKSKLDGSQTLINDLKLQLEGNCVLSPPIIELDQLKLDDFNKKKIRFALDTKEDIASGRFAEETKENIDLNN